MAQRFTEFLRAKPLFQALNNAIVHEADRWLLWFPVGLGFGVALYFLLPFEPPLIPGLVAVGLGLVGMVVGRWHGNGTLCALSL
ncbi:MAG: hypothetical protein ACKVJQ_08285 [Alphaproteobacteria bacterium]|jgi:competence protein ComEC